tara:strand:+ start:144 stop:323 length:180 start_codon:yes stop_codon:yes gene_type:complete
MVETLMIKTFGMIIFLMALKQALIHLSEMKAPNGIGFPGYNPSKEHPSFAIEEMRAVQR